MSGELAINSSDIFSVRGRAVIVTGASVGLGERFTRVLATNGANVLVEEVFVAYLRGG